MTFTIFDRMIDNGHKFYSGPSPPINDVLSVKIILLKCFLIFYRKSFMVSMLANRLINFNYIMYGDRYRSKIEFSTNPNHNDDSF